MCRVDAGVGAGWQQPCSSWELVGVGKGQGARAARGRQPIQDEIMQAAAPAAAASKQGLGWIMPGWASWLCAAPEARAVTDW